MALVYPRDKVRRKSRQGLPRRVTIEPDTSRASHNEPDRA